MQEPVSRTASKSRKTKETAIKVSLDLDGSGETEINTGLPFFDHMLAQLGRHAGVDLLVEADGDLEVDAHHTVEDVGLVLGECVNEALGDRSGIRRFSSISVPLDEALVAVALDISGRPYLDYVVPIAPDSPPLGEPGFDPQLAEEYWRAFVMNSAITLHVRLIEGRNIHHIIEASFKAVARCLRDALCKDGSSVPSTKGVL